MKNLLKNLILLICAALILTACGKNDEKYDNASIERSKLILRLFDSLEQQDYQTALIQAKKLRQLNSQNIYLINAIETCTINTIIEKINKLIEENKIQEAYSLMKNLSEQYPTNEKVKSNFEKMEKILTEKN
ncbi:MAG: hypothetical protein IJW31_08675 [Lentisphaeria bacterium]|nr:hypothetical protein [Lentisphaeria bacterium]